MYIPKFSSAAKQTGYTIKAIRIDTTAIKTKITTNLFT